MTSLADRERVVSAAVFVAGVVLSMPAPARHHTIVHWLRRRDGGAPLLPGDQGFLTSKGRFVDRAAAAALALDAGQITAPKGLLCSTDLW